MKKIKVLGPIILNVKGKDPMSFTPGMEYTVDDEIANHPYLKTKLAWIEDISVPKKQTSESKEETVKAQEEQSKEDKDLVNEEPKEEAVKTNSRGKKKEQ